MTDSNQDAFADAQKAQNLRYQISEYAANAVKYGHVDRDWVNTQLSRIGADPVTTTALYRLNIPITGNYGATVTAASRAEALERFNQYVTAIAAAGEVRGGYNGGVFGVELTGGDPVFFSGPQDPPEISDAVLDAESTAKAIREMLMEGVAGQGWGHSYASEAVAEMGLEPLPSLHTKTVTVPVSGTAQVPVPVFDGADDDAVQRAVSATLSRSGTVAVKPDEVGQAFTVRGDLSESMGLTVVNDEEF